MRTNTSVARSFTSVKLDVATFVSQAQKCLVSTDTQSWVRRRAVQVGTEEARSSDVNIVEMHEYNEGVMHWTNLFRLVEVMMWAAAICVSLVHRVMMWEC